MRPRWRSGVPVALVVTLTGCGSAFEPGSPEQEGGYNFNLAARAELSNTIGNTAFEGKWTTWDPDIGVIVLGPEEEGEPLAQVIINLGREVTVIPNPFHPVPTYQAREFGYKQGVRDGTAAVDSVTLSTTARRVGTGEEIDGKLYELGAPEGRCENLLDVGSWYDDYVEGQFCFMMDRVIVNPDDQPERIELTGMFLAINP